MKVSEREMIELMLTGKMAGTVFTKHLLEQYEKRLEDNKDKSAQGYAEWLAWQHRKKELKK